MKIRRFTPKQTFQWIGCGLRFWKRKPLPWLLSGFLLSVFGLVVLTIPFFGVFFFAFFMPVVYASMFDTLTLQLDPSRTSDAKKISPALFPFSALFKTVITEQGALVLFIPGLIAFIVALAVQVVFSIVGGPYTAIKADILDIGTFNLLRLLGAYVIAYAIYVVLMSNYFYVVPLCMRDDVTAKAALVGGVRISFRNILSLSVFLAVVFSPLLISVILLHAIPVVGVAAWIVTGSVVFPLAAHSAYCGNRLTFVNS
jgi:hypothetical protein